MRWEATADDWASKVEGWTATTNGPYSPKPYYLRVTKDGNPNAGTTYSIGDGGPGAADQRSVTDPSFLELVRLGVKRWDDPAVKSSVAVVDKRLGVDTPNGRFWHRFDFDGYGETADGGPWDLSDPDTFQTKGRLWPIFAGERGEYELLAGDRRAARGRLASIAKTGNQGYLIPEQVWDENPPSGRPGFPRGEGTLSATPLAWSHAQLVRLAWSIEAGRPVERPSIVAVPVLGLLDDSLSDHAAMAVASITTRRQRGAVQLLHRPPGLRALDIVRALLAVQAQDLRAAKLALRARGELFTAADVDAALTEQRTLVRGWLGRGTLHIVAREDYWWLLALTAQARYTNNSRRLRQEGVSEADAERALKIIETRPGRRGAAAAKGAGRADRGRGHPHRGPGDRPPDAARQPPSRDRARTGPPRRAGLRPRA